MCGSLIHIHNHSHSSLSVNTKMSRVDPTKTLGLQNRFVADFRRRFNKVTRTMVDGIVKKDIFGLNPTTYITPREFAFLTNPNKVSAFMVWLNILVKNEILQVGYMNQLGQASEVAWTDMYVLDSYKRGVIRARYELRQAGYDVPSIEKTGGIGASMSLPFHIDRVGLLYIRAYNELKGITAAMDVQVSKVLAQGMIDGDGPRVVARKLVKAITGIGEDLGITDTLGRYIPAMRRAEMLARTELIRAHHVAMIQEYRNWELAGVYVLAEFLTAGDSKVCPICAGIEAQGKEYSLDEAEGLIPVHPNCFIDPQVPIYTSKGWKPIGKVEIGDKVLTHKKRFRKVTALIRNKQKQPDVVTFMIRKGYTLSMTANHPVLIGTNDSAMTRWIEAGKVTKGMKIMLLANECKRCGKSIPYYRTYCTRTCLSKDITDKQWANPEHRKNISKKTSAQLYREYDNGTRDKYETSKKANGKVRQMVKEGEWAFWMDEEYFDKVRKVTNTPFLNECSSRRMTENNPMLDPVTVEKAKQSVAKYYLENPERRLNALMAGHRKSGKMTFIEERVKNILDKLGVNYVYQYPIFRYNVDFAIPDLKIVIECDGEYWHQDKEKDDIRQKRIEDEGWLVLRYSGSKINTQINKVEKELSRVLSNHTGDYGLIAQEIISIKKWKAKYNVNLYNLTVEEDESYIAKGVVVHNCRCITLPISEEIKQNRLL